MFFPRHRTPCAANISHRHENFLTILKKYFQDFLFIWKERRFTSVCGAKLNAFHTRRSCQPFVSCKWTRYVKPLTVTSTRGISSQEVGSCKQPLRLYNAKGQSYRTIWEEAIKCNKQCKRGIDTNVLYFLWYYLNSYCMRSYTCNRLCSRLCATGCVRVKDFPRN